MKKSAQRRRKHCAPSRAKKFRPAADPLPGGAGRPKFNQLKMVTTFTYKPSLVRIDARNFELSCYQTHPHTNTHTPTHPQTGPITIHCAAASAWCNKCTFMGLRIPLSHDVCNGYSEGGSEELSPCSHLSPLQ